MGILTIAQWEQYGKKTRVHRYRSLSKLKITEKTACKVPVILKMIADGKVPKKLSEVEVNH